MSTLQWAILITSLAIFLNIITTTFVVLTERSGLILSMKVLFLLLISNLGVWFVTLQLWYQILYPLFRSYW